MAPHCAAILGALMRWLPAVKCHVTARRGKANHYARNQVSPNQCKFASGLLNRKERLPRLWCGSVWECSRLCSTRQAQGRQVREAAIWPTRKLLGWPVGKGISIILADEDPYFRERLPDAGKRRPGRSFFDFSYLEFCSKSEIRRATCSTPRKR